jgi:hypothetical protein
MVLAMPVTTVAASVQLGTWSKAAPHARTAAHFCQLRISMSESFSFSTRDC